MQQPDEHFSGAHPRHQYLSDQYALRNPSWDVEDSNWKADLVAKMLADNGIQPDSICEVGCGAGGCLARLRDHYFDNRLIGYDIAPAAERFWTRFSGRNIEFHLGDFTEVNRDRYDVLLLLDVIEHVADPHTFLMQLRGVASYYVFHIPLDLSALSILREKPILHVREKVGHIHYFTKNLALALLRECGYHVKAWRYSGAAQTSPQKTIKTMLARFPRMLAYWINKDVGVRLLGGETLLTLATVHDAEKKQEMIQE